MQFLKNIIILILGLISMFFLLGLFFFNDNIFLKNIVPCCFILGMLFLRKKFGKSIMRTSEFRSFGYLWSN
jgi:hypothetical protein